MEQLTDVLLAIASLCSALVLMYAAFNATFKGEWVKSGIMSLNVVIGLLIVYYVESLAHYLTNILGNVSQESLYGVAMLFYLVALILVFLSSSKSKIN